MQSERCTNCNYQGYNLVSCEDEPIKGVKFCSQSCEDDYLEKIDYMQQTLRVPLHANGDPDWRARHDAWSDDSDSDHSAYSRTPDR